MLVLDRVSKVYKVGTFGGRELRAVSDVSFSVGPGQVVSLIGESGSGKSTIGKMILRLVPVTEGTITFDGTDVSTLRRRHLKEYYRGVQGVFQDPFSSYNPIFKTDHVFQLVKDQFFPGVADSEWDGRLEVALNGVGLDPGRCLHKYPHQLSGGQLQRLLIARALLLDVDFLVADEIISMLDASNRIDVLNLLADLRAEGLSILFITHDLSLGYYLSDRSVILYRGHIVEMGATPRVFANPLHPYTRMLLGSVARLDRRWDDEIAAPGPGPGCVVCGGCNPNGADGPASRLVEIEEDHMVACHDAGKRGGDLTAGVGAE